MLNNSAYSSHICFYNYDDLEKTLQNHDALSKEEKCLHVRKAHLKQLGVEFYALADWPCYQHQPTINKDCDKEESSKIITTIKKSFKSPVKRPQYITFDLISEQYQFLEFKEGSIVNQKSIISYRNPCVVLANHSPKAKGFDIWKRSFDVIKHPASINETTDAYVEVLFEVWEGEPEKSTSHSSGLLLKLVLVPEPNKADQQINNSDETKRSIEMDPSLMALIAAWLLPPLAKGGLEFSKTVGKGLGEVFVELVNELLGITESDNNETGKLPKEHDDRNKITEQTIINAMKSRPDTTEKIYRELRISLGKLLRNNINFTKSDIEEELIRNLGYTNGDFNMTTQASLANTFVERVFADNKVADLITEIQKLKPHLFDAKSG